MKSNRRQFIKTAGAGLIGVGITPAFGEISQFFNPYDIAAFQRVTPESQGVSSQSIRQFITAANESGISWHSFMLLRHGKVVAEGWWKPFESRNVHTLFSLSKSFTSTAIGLLVKEGKLDIHSKVISFFPNDLPANISDNLKEMSVRSMLTMNTGHGADTMPKMRASQDSWVKTYLAQPVEYAPGTHFLYNTGNTYMLGAVLNKVTGQTLEEYLRPRLFEPLGFSGYDWEVSPQGLNTAGYGLRIRTEDIAKLGQMYLQKGKWNGSTILTESWVDEATSKQTESQVNNGDWSQGYGYQFWRCTHNFYRGDGAYGQFCIVMPEHDAVLAVTGQSQDMQKSMNIIWDHLPTGMQTGALPQNKPEQEALKKELAGLVLPVAKGMTSSSSTAKYDKKKWTIDANDLKVQSLQFAFSKKGVVLTAMAGDKTTRLEYGWESWVTSPGRDPYVFMGKDMLPMPSRIAGTATWVDDRTLQLNTRFVEAIFGDRLTCAFDGEKLNVTFLNSVAETARTKTPDSRKPLTGSM
ncbi:MAG: serine hydrolase [Bacteroidetes bacterium]|nr:serine hydrolase [Bacteroidota bacterium]